MTIRYHNAVLAQPEPAKGSPRHLYHKECPPPGSEVVDENPDPDAFRDQDGRLRQPDCPSCGRVIVVSAAETP